LLLIIIFKSFKKGFNQGNFEQSYKSDYLELLFVAVENVVEKDISL
jgi:hypothetical protein